MFREGLRVAEVCALRVRDVILSGDTARIKVIGKGRKYRAVELSQDTFRIYTEYSNYLSINLNAEKLMIMPNGKPAYKRYFQLAISTVSNNCITPHKLRHQYVTNNRGVISESLISSSIGHSKFGNVMQYGEINERMIERDFFQPSPERIESYAIPSMVKAGDFIPIEIIRDFINRIENQHTKMMVYLMAYCGLKTSELLTLKRRNYIKTKRRFEIGERVIPVRFYDAQFINKYFSNHFPNDKIFKLTHRMVLYRIQKEAKRQRIEINGKLLHASYIVWQLNRGVSPIILAAMLGTNYNNVARYIPCASVARQIAIKRCGESGRP